VWIFKGEILGKEPQSAEGIHWTPERHKVERPPESRKRKRREKRG
jgi:ribosomal protein S3